MQARRGEAVAMCAMVLIIGTHRSMSSTFTSVGMSAFSFCSPSRGPTCVCVCVYVVGAPKKTSSRPMIHDPSRTLHGRLRLTSTMRTAEGALGKAAAKVASPRRVVQPWQQLPAVPAVAEAEADDMSRGRRRRRRTLVLTIERRAAAAAAKAPVTRLSSIPVAGVVGWG